MTAPIQLSENEQIRIERKPRGQKPLRDRDVVDFRIWRKTKLSYRPTKQGVTFDFALLPMVLEALALTRDKGEV
ncbi:MAG: hypothetical protein AB3N21_13815 [Ruegeria sp.]|uniref:hypothetical protein n=1 Tax=Ruegeria sp. TaxID=1879320 RepID=UPI00349EDFE1